MPFLPTNQECQSTEGSKQALKEAMYAVANNIVQKNNNYYYEIWYLW